MMSLYDKVLEPYVVQERKHGVDAEAFINKMSNVQLLRLISYALDELVEQRQNQVQSSQKS